MVNREELISASAVKNMTIAQAQEWLKTNGVKPGTVPLAKYKQEHGKRETQTYLTIVFALEILRDQNIMYLEGENLLDLVVSKIPASFDSGAVTIQGYLKDWIGMFVTNADYMHFTYEMALNIVKIRMVLRELGSGKVNVNPGEQESLHIINKITEGLKC